MSVLITLICSTVIADEVKKMSLDNALGLGTTIQTDLMEKVEGKGSIRIATQYPTSVCLGEVTGLNVENSRLIYAAKVKSDLDGIAYLEMWAYVGEGQYFSRGMNDAIKGKTDWKSIQTPFLFQKGQNPKKVILNLVINGQGTVWIDDVVLSKEPLK
jgi:hypothetical protein